jgi:uncharacterized membrane protein YphA (DoxX/SURF4 family)
MARPRYNTGILLRLEGIRATRQRLIIAVLLALALRALIPIGFMPAGDGTLSLMICPGGFPTALLPQEKTMQDGMGMPLPQPHHSGHGVMEDGYCVFTTGFASAPPPLLVAEFVLLVACLGVVITRVAALAGVRLVHVPQARAPPAV